MPKLMILVGLPCCGKSTFRDMTKKDKPFVYSTDDMIEEAAEIVGKTYQEIFPDSIKLATNIANKGVDAAIKERQDVVWDQTNLTKKKRRSIINRFRGKGYDVTIVTFKKPNDVELWKQKVLERKNKSIPEYVLDNMYNSYEVTEMDEVEGMNVYYMYMEPYFERK